MGYATPNRPSRTASRVGASPHPPSDPIRPGARCVTRQGGEGTAATRDTELRFGMVCASTSSPGRSTGGCVVRSQWRGPRFRRFGRATRVLEARQWRCDRSDFAYWSWRRRLAPRCTRPERSGRPLGRRIGLPIRGTVSVWRSRWRGQLHADGDGDDDAWNFGTADRDHDLRHSWPDGLVAVVDTQAQDTGGPFARAWPPLVGANRCRFGSLWLRAGACPARAADLRGEPVLRRSV